MTRQEDDKYNKASVSDESDRRWKFYAMLVTLMLDVYTSQAKVLEHLTLWSWILHMLYFELPLSSSSKILPWVHGPSLCGSYALFMMYVWVMLANPNMEFDLAPEGRSDIVIYLRAAWLHCAPPVLHYYDMKNHSAVLRRAYQPQKGLLLTLWTSFGGYLAMGLTWEACFDDAGAATYNVTRVSPEVFINVSKVLAVSSCGAAFMSITKPKLIDA